MRARPLGLLVSPAVESACGPRIDAMARQSGVALHLYTRPQGRTALARIDAAFFSRELYEGSTLHTPGPRCREFFGWIDAAPNLRWLHVCSSGLDLPVYQAAIARGVRVTPASGATALPIAQSVIAAILAQGRGFDHWLAAQREREWRPLVNEQRRPGLVGQRVAIIGAGSIAREIARLAFAVGLEPITVRRSPEPMAPCRELVAVDRIDALLPSCDWLVLACPLTPETRGLIGARQLALLAPHARLVNISRGEVVDEAALVQALQERRLAGAFLDVFQQEPLPPSSPLWTLPGVWIAPHNCGAAQGHEERVMDTFLLGLQSWLHEQKRTNEPGPPPSCELPEESME